MDTNFVTEDCKLQIHSFHEYSIWMNMVLKLWITSTATILMYNYIRKKKFKSKHFGWESGTLSFLPLWFAVLPWYSTIVAYCLRKHSPACEAQGKKANGSWNAVCVYLPNPAFLDVELDKEKRCPFISTKDMFFHWAGPGRTNQEKCIAVRVQAGIKWRYSQFN